ncbi:MAG: hypothetical protein AB7G76_13505 [Steroidobacteraceae bacterium]
MNKSILSGLITAAALLAFSSGAQAQLLGGAVNGTLNGSVGGSISAEPSMIGAVRDGAMAPVGRVKDRAGDAARVQRARVEGAARGAAVTSVGTVDVAKRTAGNAAQDVDASASGAVSAAVTAAASSDMSGRTASPVAPAGPADTDSRLLDASGSGHASADAAIDANGTHRATATTPATEPAAVPDGKLNRPRDNDKR